MAPCSPNANSCSDLPAPAAGNRRKCGTCNTGYEGNGARCTDIDACDAAPCDPNAASCTDLAAPALGDASGRLCGPCNAGYTGDGDTCSDIDACAAFPCAALSLGCVDVAGGPNSTLGRSCQGCVAPFEGTGELCAPPLAVFVSTLQPIIGEAVDIAVNVSGANATTANITLTADGQTRQLTLAPGAQATELFQLTTSTDKAVVITAVYTAEVDTGPVTSSVDTVTVFLQVRRPILFFTIDVPTEKTVDAGDLVVFNMSIEHRASSRQPAANLSVAVAAPGDYTVVSVDRVFQPEVLPLGYPETVLATVTMMVPQTVAVGQTLGAPLFRLEFTADGAPEPRTVFSTTNVVLITQSVPLADAVDAVVHNSTVSTTTGADLVPGEQALVGVRVRLPEATLYDWSMAVTVPSPLQLVDTFSTAPLVNEFDNLSNDDDIVLFWARVCFCDLTYDGPSGSIVTVELTDFVTPGNVSFLRNASAAPFTVVSQRRRGRREEEKEQKKEIGE